MRKIVICCCFFLISGCVSSLVFNSKAYKSAKFDGKKLLVLPISRLAIKVDDNDRDKFSRGLKVNDYQIEDTIKGIFNKYLIGYPLKYVKNISVIDNRGEMPVSFQDSLAYKLTPAKSNDNIPMKVKVPKLSGIDLKSANIVVCVNEISFSNKEAERGTWVGPGINGVGMYGGGRLAAIMMKIIYVVYDIDNDKIVSAGELECKRMYPFNVTSNGIKDAIKNSIQALFYNTPFKFEIPQS